MSGTWSAMLDAEEHANDPAWAFEAYRKRNPRMLAYSGPTLRSVWADAVRWVLARQNEWYSLDERSALRELRAGSSSIFYPIFRDDPTFIGDCPRHGPITVNSEGYCSSCGYDFSK